MEETSKKASRGMDPELLAMGRVKRIIDTLEPSAQRRVLQWAMANIPVTGLDYVVERKMLEGPTVAAHQ